MCSSAWDSRWSAAGCTSSAGHGDSAAAVEAAGGRSGRRLRGGVRRVVGADAAVAGGVLCVADLYRRAALLEGVLGGADKLPG